jgi:hypothetical protein
MDHVENAVLLLLRDGRTYSTVAWAAISMDCAENTIPLVVYMLLLSNSQLL